jgi:hypothetical protein
MLFVIFRAERSTLSLWGTVFFNMRVLNLHQFSRIALDSYSIFEKLKIKEFQHSFNVHKDIATLTFLKR